VHEIHGWSRRLGWFVVLLTVLMLSLGDATAAEPKKFTLRLLLDSRVVAVPMASHPTCVMFSSWKPLFFNSLKHELRFSDNAGA